MLMKKFLFVFMTAFFALGVFAKNPVVTLETTMKDDKGKNGVIKIELYQDKAPVSVKNFLNYAKKKFYNDTVFHRVIDGFVIQGGGFDKKMKEKKTDKPIINEANNGLKNSKGTIAMARTTEPNSATSQFYINLSDNYPLDYSPGNPGYAVFGKVIDGMDIVMKIAKAKTMQHENGMMDVPANLEAVMISKVTVN